jgi:hypothetical protein
MPGKVKYTEIVYLKVNAYRYFNEGGDVQKVSHFDLKSGEQFQENVTKDFVIFCS